MRTVELKLLKFDELTDKAKDKAIQDFRERQWKYGECLMLFDEYCKKKISEKGFEDIKLQYSLSYSQDDGLSFSAKTFNKLEELYLEVLGKGKECTAKLLADNTTVQITGNTGNRYCYASKTYIALYVGEYTSSVNTDLERVNEICVKVEKKLQNIYIDLCKQLEDDGYAEIEYQNSDEAIIRNIKINEYEYTEDGKLFN